MASIPASARVLWNGFHSTIPATWTRDTDFDAKFLHPSTTAAGTNGGGTHTHDASHGHTGDDHTHATSSNAETSTGGPNTQFFALPGKGGGSYPKVAKAGHQHQSIASAVSNRPYDSVSLTTSDDEFTPPYYELIVIAPPDGDQDLPFGAVIFSDLDASTNYQNCDGGGGSPDIRGKFIRAPTTGGDAGASGSGTGNHGHTVSGTHVHALGDHYHVDSRVGSSVPPAKGFGSGSTQVQTGGRHHELGLVQQVGSGDTSATALSVNTVPGVPAYYKLLGIQQTHASDQPVPASGILPYVGTPGSIPSGWLLCDGSNDTPNLVDMIQGADTEGQVGDVGGDNDHTHFTVAHNHTDASAAHTHTPATPSNILIVYDLNGATTRSTLTHTHSTWTIGNNSSQTIPSTSFETGSGDLRPAYRTMLFIKQGLAASSVSIIQRGMVTA